jgi:two-component system response regulator VicR
MNEQPERTFRIGKAVIDPKESTVCIEGVVCPLQARELNLLEFLFKSPGKCFTREELLTSVWGYESNQMMTRTVDQAVAMVRRKIGDHGPKHNHLKTIRGSGYCLFL